MITVTISLVAFVQSHLTMFGSWWAKRFILSGIIRLFGWSFLVIYHMEIAALPFLLALICNLVIASSCKFNSAEIIVNSIGAIFSPFCIAIQVNTLILEFFLSILFSRRRMLLTTLIQIGRRKKIF